MEIVTAARWFGHAKAPPSFWCQGLNQSIHGKTNGAALIHLHLTTGKIGKPGMGPFSLTGQLNAMGGRETGTTANLLPGRRQSRRVTVFCLRHWMRAAQRRKYQPSAPLGWADIPAR
jgi:anaerobic selenocysteine-containing dehydrogenase